MQKFVGYRSGRLNGFPIHRLIAAPLTAKRYLALVGENLQSVVDVIKLYLEEIWII